MKHKQPNEGNLARLPRKPTQSGEGENDASEKVNTQYHHDASEADALSLFGGGDIDEIEDTVL